MKYIIKRSISTPDISNSNLYETNKAECKQNGGVSCKQTHVIKAKTVKMVSLSSLLQSPVQAILRPAMWLPFIKNLHSYKEV